MSRIYPDLEDHARALAAQQQPPRPHLQCEQILQRASSINKDLINRMQNSEIAKKTYICGFDLRTKQLWVLVGLFMVFFTSCFAASLIWFTDSFDQFVLSHLVIQPNSEALTNFVNPTFKTSMKIHLFNYTNIDDFQLGRAKRLMVQDLGPYFYEEIKERINVEFNNDGTISFQEKLSHKFIPRLSKGRQNDIVMVPDLISFATANRVSGLHSFMSLTMSLKTPFMRKPADRYIWGYEDTSYSLVKGFLQLRDSTVQEDVGILAHRNGTLKHVVTIQTGENGYDDIGTVKSLNGYETFGKWSTEECDNVHGSEGTIFPPQLIREKKPFNMFLREACRKLPYVFSEETTIFNGSVPAYKYVMPTNVFDSADKNPDNQCYCDMEKGSCPPQGFYDLTHCALETPLFMSLPHFYNVDPEYIKVDGLLPTYARSENFLNMHPRMAFPLGGRTTFQLNLLAKPGYGYPMFKEEIMLPVAWFEVTVDEDKLPEDVVQIINRSTFTVRNLELAIKYVSLILVILTLTAISIILRAKLEETCLARANNRAEGRLV